MSLKDEVCECGQPLNYIVDDFCERCHRELRPKEKDEVLGN